MSLSPGTRLGAYEIADQLGVGGMGEVYRATDTNLKRIVAVKVLPDSVVGDTERVARFQREAEILASLNHPNITAIYGLERSGSITALVMELVEGPTLADRIAQGAIPLDQALPIAQQIAEALEVAHGQGIVHRDLKPANVKVRPDGTVKVLDFGLAKAIDRIGSRAGLSQSPTITTPAMTGAGTILGTVAYMSPEQMRGKPVDPRADVWAFGCVLYEMLTGHMAFAGETTSDAIARVLEREPNWRALPAETPARIRELLRQCLQKDQQQRLEDIAHARVDIQASRTSSHRLRRAVRWPVAVAAGVVALAVAGAAWWYASRSTPPVARAPVSILIADLENRTNDPSFDRALEPVLRMMLEGAGFVTAYDRTQLSPRLGVRAPERLDERSAREIAVKQGLGVIVSSSLDRAANEYVFSLKAAEAITGTIIASPESRASEKGKVMDAATRAVAAVRTALGEDTSDSSRMFAMATLSVTSLDVLRHYADAMQAQSDGRFEDALRSATQAVELDPRFGVGYQLQAVAARALGRQQDAEKYITEALRHLDAMTERERFSTRGMFFRLAGDYPQCVKEYGELIARYAADVSAHNQVALCASQLRDLRKAQEEMRRAIAILPNRTIFRDNLALYLDYGSDFQAAEREVRAIPAPDVGSALALAFAQIGQGDVSQAIESYQRLGTMGTLGASFSASGLADVALYEGRYANAVQILEKGAAVDLTSMNPDRAAAKFVALAYVYNVQGQGRSAIAAIERALMHSKAVKIRFSAARSFVEADDVASATPLMASLASEPRAEPKAFAKVVEGAIALKRGDPRKAIEVLQAANGLLDTWIGHFDLGRAYMEAGEFLQADSEFDLCIKRRGESLALFLDEEPTYGVFPPVHYYQGRVREAIKTEGFANSYRTYLDIRGKSSEDPLVPQARRRSDR